MTDYLDSLAPKQAAKAAWMFRVIQTVSPVPAQYLKKMPGTGDLWEVRVVFGGDIFRLLGFREGTGRLVLCHGFTKKSQKTPPREIAVAQARKDDHEKRQH